MDGGLLKLNNQSNALHKEKGWNWTMNLQKEINRKLGFGIERQKHTKISRKGGGVVWNWMKKMTNDLQKERNSLELKDEGDLHRKKVWN
jgi:hypothetical protein